LLVNASGEVASNQFLPPLPASAGSPGAAATPRPGLIEYVLDADGDGKIDGDLPPTFVVP
jgi:hypothetical protein